MFPYLGDRNTLSSPISNQHDMKRIKLKKNQVIRIKIKINKLNKLDKSLHNTITIYSDIPSSDSVTVIL
jgi:hypothetical protein